MVPYHPASSLPPASRLATAGGIPPPLCSGVVASISSCTIQYGARREGEAADVGERRSVGRGRTATRRSHDDIWGSKVGEVSQCAVAALLRGERQAEESRIPAERGACQSRVEAVPRHLEEPLARARRGDLLDGVAHPCAIAAAMLTLTTVRSFHAPTRLLACRLGARRKGLGSWACQEVVDGISSNSVVGRGERWGDSFFLTDESHK